MVKRTYKRPRRGLRKTLRRPRRATLVRRIPQQILSVKRTFHAGTWAWATTSTAGFWQYYTAQFNQLPNVAEYKALFDLYKISAVKFTFRLNIDGVNPSDVAGATGGGMGMVHYIIDPSNNFTPTGTWSQATLNSFMELGSVRSRDMTKPFSIYFKSMISNDVTGSLTNGQPMRPPYIRTDSDNVAHNGVHVFLQPSNAFATTPTFRVTFDIFMTFYLRLKGNK